MPTFDCSAVPATVAIADEVLLEAPRGYNDVVFDDDGALLGWDGDHLRKATDPYTFDIVAPNISMIYKMGYLPDGDVVGARSAGGGSGILRIDPSGGSEVLLPSTSAYGLAVGSDGQIYAATNYTVNGDAILRVDPATGYGSQWVDASMAPPRAIAFNRDFTRLYFGTVDDGHVMGVELDANLDPVGEPYLVATVPDSWHDTLEVDACGQIYVGSFFCSCIYRINTDGSIVRFLDWDTNSYGHGFKWGRAEGGWDEQSIYITHPYTDERITELFIGVPGADWTGEVVGGVTL